MYKTSTFFVALLSLVSCSAEINPSSVQAKAGAPVAAQVPESFIERNPSNAFTYLVVEPVRVTDQGAEYKSNVNLNGSYKDKSETATLNGELKTISTSYRTYLLQRQRQISYQLTSSLSNIKDFKLIDHQMFSQNPANFKNGKYGANGPFTVRAVITECRDAVTSQKNKFNVPGIYGTRDKAIEGIVGLDVSVIGTDGSVITSFPSQGTYIYKDKANKAGLLVNIKESEVVMRSTIDQALRAALNNAAVRLHSEIYGN